MTQEKPSVLALNGGSSSIRFALYQAGDPPRRSLYGKIERIGLRGTILMFDSQDRNQRDSRGIGDLDHRSAANFLIGWLEQRIGLGSISAVGHRLVNGGAKYREPQRVTTQLLDELRGISAYAPEHLPLEIALIDLIRERVPVLPQVVCFDTAFHRDMPRVAKIVPIPRRFTAHGVERYGFHGLSYSFLMEELTRVVGSEAAQGCDLDPGLIWFLARTERMTAEQFHRMVNHESGLLGVSETSSDLRDLLTREGDDVRAAEAIALFCYQVKKCVGSYAAALGGLDTLVFAGGIGENAPVIRARICEGLGFLGIELDRARNEGSEPVISSEASRVDVRVIPTDEEVMIARTVSGVLAQGTE